MLVLATLLAALAVTSPDVTVSVQPIASGGFAVEGAFTVDAGSREVWPVLVDFDHLDAFIPDLRSQVQSREGANTALVAQSASPGVLGLHLQNRVLLRVFETPFDRIDFADVLHEDFTAFDGTWRLVPVGGRTKVTYAAHATPRFVPPLFGAMLIRRTVTDMLGAFEAEVERRSVRR